MNIGSRTTDPSQTGRLYRFCQHYCPLSYITRPHIRIGYIIYIIYLVMLYLELSVPLQFPDDSSYWCHGHIMIYYTWILLKHICQYVYDSVWYIISCLYTRWEIVCSKNTKIYKNTKGTRSAFLMKSITHYTIHKTISSFPDESHLSALNNPCTWTTFKVLSL